MPEHPPPEFRYIGFAADFPAKGALEYVLCRFIDMKRDAMSTSVLSDATIEDIFAAVDAYDGKIPDQGVYPNRDIWMGFDYSRDDLIAMAADPGSIADLGKFQIQQSGDAESGTGEDSDDGGHWVLIKTLMVLNYTAATLSLRFSQGALPDAIFCTCWVNYAEGDGGDLKTVAALLGLAPEP